MLCPEFAIEKLEGSDSAAFRTHRKACPNCSRDLEDCDEVRETYRSAAARETFPGIRVRHRWKAPAWLPVGAAAAMLIAVLAAIVLRTAPEPSTSSSSAPLIHARIPLAPWDRSDRAIETQIADAWRTLEALERRRP
jgi:hypothetical protein